MECRTYVSLAVAPFCADASEAALAARARECVGANRASSFFLVEKKVGVNLDGPGT
jgi:hypothetical protein